MGSRRAICCAGCNRSGSCPEPADQTRCDEDADEELEMVGGCRDDGAGITRRMFAQTHSRAGRRATDGRTDGRTNGQAADGQTDRQKDRRMDRVGPDRIGLDWLG